MGTIRLAFAFGAVLLGVLYLALAVGPLATGAIEWRPTSLSIDTAQSEGFPESWYLEVTDGWIVLSLADLKLKGGDGEKPELWRLTVPVVNESLWAQWQTSIEQGDKLDASGCLLLASFQAEQVMRLWPEVVERVANGQPLDLPPVKMTLVGDTELVEHMVFRPYDFIDRTADFDPKKARWLRFERHFDSPGRCVKNLAIGIGLLLVGLAAFRYHFSRPDDVSQDVVDWSALPDVGGDAGDLGDIDLDI